MVEDYWPEDLESLEILAPVAILTQQASILGKKTNGVVEGFVNSKDVGSKLHFKFYLVAPTLGNYRYPLFTMSHDICMYPIDIELEEEIFEEIYPDEFNEYQETYLKPPKKHQIEDEALFIEFLKMVFSSTKTRQIIGSMLAQSTQIKESTIA